MCHLENMVKLKIIDFDSANGKESIGKIILLILFFSSFFSFFLKDKTLSIILFSFLTLYMIIFNLISNRKFDIHHKIHTSNNYLELDENGLTIRENLIEWKNLKDIKISVKVHKGMNNIHHIKTVGKVRLAGNRIHYYGYEFNFFEYNLYGKNYKHKFYIENESSLIHIKKDIKELILPKLYSLKNIKRENILIEKLEYRDLQSFKKKYNINRVNDDIHFN